MDVENNEYRASTLLDLYNAARITDLQDNVHFFQRPMVARDMETPLDLDINTLYASLAGTNFFAKGSAYNASKFGLVGFTQAVMLDLRDYGIKTTTIMPGSVATHFNDHVPNEADAWKIQPEDLGQLTVDLLKMHPRTLPSKVEVRPSQPPRK